jgi:nitrite reductase/ring-hydroxylating ferredoxin subunit
MRTLSICRGPARAPVIPVRLCREDELPPTEGRGFSLRHGDRDIQLFIMQRDSRRHAYLNRCPHTGINLDWTPDRFLDWTGRMIQCATHGALFRIEDGYCVAGPCAGRSLIAVPVREADGFIEVLLPEGTPSAGVSPAAAKTPGNSLQ